MVYAFAFSVHAAPGPDTGDFLTGACRAIGRQYPGNRRQKGA